MSQELACSGAPGSNARHSTSASAKAGAIAPRLLSALLNDRLLSKRVQILVSQFRSAGVENA